MIYGEVNARREAVVEIAVGGPGGTEVSLHVIVDTGFSDYLTLPKPDIDTLGLPFQATDKARLADGTIITTELYRARAKLMNSWVSILAQQSEGDVLAGMSLIENMILTVEAVIGGQVTVSPLD